MVELPNDYFVVVVSAHPTVFFIKEGEPLGEEGSLEAPASLIATDSQLCPE